MGRENGCEAPIHHPDCPCIKCKHRSPEICIECPLLTMDHFTPRSISTRLGWSQLQVGSSLNHLFLSSYCHWIKDFSSKYRSQKRYRVFSSLDALKRFNRLYDDPYKAMKRFK